MTELQNDTKKRIIEAASFLFGMKGYEGTSTREIGRRAGVNIASLNYHFKSKQNLMEEVAYFAWGAFKTKISALAQREDVNSSSSYALAIFEAFLQDGTRCLNEFKLFLEAKNVPGDIGMTPIAYEELKGFLKKELHANVPEHEYIFIYNVTITYLSQAAILSMAYVGQKYNQTFLPDKENSLKTYVVSLVETLVRDMNQRYA